MQGGTHARPHERQMLRVPELYRCTYVWRGSVTFMYASIDVFCTHTPLCIPQRASSCSPSRALLTGRCRAMREPLMMVGERRRNRSHVVQLARSVMVAGASSQRRSRPTHKPERVSLLRLVCSSSLISMLSFEAPAYYCCIQRLSHTHNVMISDRVHE